MTAKPEIVLGRADPLVVGSTAALLFLGAVGLLSRVWLAGGVEPYLEQAFAEGAPRHAAVMPFLLIGLVFGSGHFALELYRLAARDWAVLWVAEGRLVGSHPALSLPLSEIDRVALTRDDDYLELVLASGEAKSVAVGLFRDKPADVLAAMTSVLASRERQ